MGSGLGVLREGFEASLVVAIVLAFLDRSNRRDGFAAVWIGIGRFRPARRADPVVLLPAPGMEIVAGLITG